MPSSRDYLDVLLSLEAWDVTVVVGVFLATIAPGLLALYLFDPTFVVEAETAKVFVLAASITIPVVAVNAFILAAVGSFTKSLGPDGPNRPKHLAFWQIVWAFIALYLPLLVAYLCDLNVVQFVFTIATIDIVAGFGILAIMRFLVHDESVRS